MLPSKEQFLEKMEWAQNHGIKICSGIFHVKVNEQITQACPLTCVSMKDNLEMAMPETWSHLEDITYFWKGFDLGFVEPEDPEKKKAYFLGKEIRKICQEKNWEVEDHGKKD